VYVMMMSVLFVTLSTFLYTIYHINMQEDSRQS